MRRKNIVFILLAVFVAGSVSCLDPSGFSFGVLKESKSKGVLIPWPEDAVKTAKKTGTIRFYFMSSEGVEMTKSVGPAYGDSCLIVFPDGETMLVDGGKTAYADMLVKNIKALGIKRLDYVVISHLHEDHYGGILGYGGAMTSFEIGKLYWNGAGSYTDSVTENMKTYGKRYAEETIALKAGDNLSIGDVKIQVLYPEEASHVKVADASDQTMNATSLLLKFSFGDFSALFGGDLYTNDELKIIGLYGLEILDVDLVKANHHGKQTSNSKEWASATTPKVVVTTSGNAMDLFPYGYYSSVGAYILNDKLDGYVRVVSDGKTCEVTSGRQRTQSINENFDKIARDLFPVTVKTVSK